MQDYEKLGVFYLGSIVKPPKNLPTDELLLYDSKHLTTHAVCLGMTGSGKTGLGIALLEEAGIDKIPAIIIDPKGDMSNLLLTFPDLSAEEFLPWIDPGEAHQKGLSPEVYADDVAKSWKEGLASSDIKPERIRNLRDSVDMVVYTPANSAGRAISVLSSFAAPPKDLIEDTGAFRDRVMTLSSSLLGLLGINADPIKSREHIFLSTIIEQAWQQGQDLDIASLIQYIQKPPFTKIGALDVETFYPLKERVALSISLNNLLASPGFKAWMEGEPLDIKNLLHTETGKPKFSIMSIAHLSDSERMFFVTLLLNEIITWMRRQPGTSSLRAMLYMDEVYGYFPPTAMPPSKTPMLTLLKQARAYGLGVMLATQNPVDLDYKGLANCGTWFIGKLQTERDIARVVEGLSVASNGNIDVQSMKELLSSIGKRIFVMRSIYENEPVLFKTRWTLSYLRGPLTLNQIQKLTDAIGRPIIAAAVSEHKLGNSSEVKPVVPPGISEYFINLSHIKGSINYVPKILGTGKLHFVDSKNRVDQWQDFCLLASPDDDGKSILWSEAESDAIDKLQLEKNALPNSQFSELPSGLQTIKNYAAFEKSLSAYLYQNQEMTLYRAPELDLTSKENESEGEFKARLTLALREKRDEMITALRSKYAEKIDAATKKLKSAQDKASQTQSQATLQKAQTIISIGSTLLGAFFGRGITKGTITEAGTTMRRAGKIGTESQKASKAEDDSQACQKQLDDLHDALQREIEGIYHTSDVEKIKIDKTEIKPRKSDISIEKLALVWEAKL